jgi:hypothetical protein
MKLLVLTLAALTIAPAPRALAGDHNMHFSGFNSSCGAPVHLRARHDLRTARIAIETRNGDATLLLTDNVLAVQLSDRTLHRIERRFREQREDYDDMAFARVIRSVVLSTVQAALEHSAECRLSDVRDVEYREGRLIVTARGGRYIFADMDVDDDDVMSGFSERDALAFVREFHRLKGLAI